MSHSQAFTACEDPENTYTSLLLVILSLNNPSTWIFIVRTFVFFLLPPSEGGIYLMLQPLEIIR